MAIHKLINPADRECSPCVSDCAGCVEESAQRAATERRKGTDRRLAATREQAPTGDGAIVLESVVQRLDCLIALARSPLTTGDIIASAESLAALRDDLSVRSEIGAKKYGTPLRINNGRRAIVDLYQEITDAIMYSAQAKMEGDEDAGTLLDLLVGIGARLAEILNERTK